MILPLTIYPSGFIRETKAFSIIFSSHETCQSEDPNRKYPQQGTRKSEISHRGHRAVPEREGLNRITQIAQIGEEGLTRGNEVLQVGLDLRASRLGVGLATEPQRTQRWKKRRYDPQITQIFTD